MAGIGAPPYDVFMGDAGPKKAGGEIKNFLICFVKRDQGVSGIKNAKCLGDGVKGGCEQGAFFLQCNAFSSNEYRHKGYRPNCKERQSPVCQSNPKGTVFRGKEKTANG
jgi:hypothetical protein